MPGSVCRGKETQFQIILPAGARDTGQPWKITTGVDFHHNAFGSSDCPCQRVPVIDALSWSASKLILQVSVNIIIKLGKMSFHLDSNQTCSMLSNFVLYFSYLCCSLHLL